MPAAEIILAILQTIRIGAGIIERHQRGELSDVEMETEWRKMKADLDAANEAWERAGR